MTSSLGTPQPLVYGKRPTDLETLARTPLLRGLDIRELSTFLDLLDEVAVAKGTCVFREAESTDMMYFVLDGEARVRRGQLELRALRPGDAFGEVALLGPSSQGTTVEAHTTMRLARLSRARYLSMADKHPKMALRFTQALAATLADQLAAMTDDVGLLAYQRSVPRRMQVRIRRGPDDLLVATGTIVGTVLPREHDGALVVAATVDARPVSLETALLSDAQVEPVTLASSLGRSIHRRSAGLVLLEALRRAAPELVVRLGAAVENGQVVHVEGAFDPRIVAAALGRLVREPIALREEVWAVDEARAHFEELGDQASVQLLAAERDDAVTLLVCGETFAPALGPVVPHAGFLEGVSVVPHPDGLLLRLGEGADRYMPVKGDVRVDPAAAELVSPREASPMTAAARRWLAGIGITSVGAFDDHCVRGHVPDLIRVAEGFHEKWIGSIADLVVRDRDRVKVIVVAGPSSSGKTTFIKRLTVQLLVDGVTPRGISLDDYYVDRERTVRDEHGELDFEAFEALDGALLREHLARIVRGERVTTARYDFVAGKSAAAGGPPISLREGDVLLLEGIHGLNPALLAGVVPERAVFRIFVHPAMALPFDRLDVLAPEDVRLLRRVVRDRHQRNYTAAETIARWSSVRRGEMKHVFPFMPNADVVFDSSLVYETSVLKTYAERYLLEVPRAHASYGVAHRLRRLVDQFVAIHPDHVPETSVIREFIGGSGFEY